LFILIIRSRIKGNHDENYLKLFAKTEEGMRIAQGIKEEPISKENVANNSTKAIVANEDTIVLSGDMTDKAVEAVLEETDEPIVIDEGEEKHNG
ncbi:MAG: hypothetical protein WAX04_03735, partial [Oscillospiraceae bacterium]